MRSGTGVAGNGSCQKRDKQERLALMSRALSVLQARGCEGVRVRGCEGARGARGGAGGRGVEGEVPWEGGVF